MGWSLNEVMEMPIPRFSMVANSIGWQVRQDEYLTQYYFAWIVSEIRNQHQKHKSRMITPEKLVGKPPKRFEDDSKSWKRKKLSKEEMLAIAKRKFEEMAAKKGG